MNRGGRPAPRAGAFIFDLDGTLVDTSLDIALSANHVRRSYGLPDLALPAVIACVGDGASELIRRILSPAGGEGTRRVVDEETVREGVARFQAHYGQHCLDRTVLYPGVLETLGRFAALPLAVATNKPAAFTHEILNGLGLAARFRRVVAADDVPRRKPDPGHLAACLEGLDVTAERVIVVGDSLNDILAARALGAVAVAVTYGFTPPRVLRDAGPDHLIDRFDRLAALFAPDGWPLRPEDLS